MSLVGKLNIHIVKLKYSGVTFAKKTKTNHNSNVVIPFWLLPSRVGSLRRWARRLFRPLFLPRRLPWRWVPRAQSLCTSSCEPLPPKSCRTNHIYEPSKARMFKKRYTYIFTFKQTPIRKTINLHDNTKQPTVGSILLITSCSIWMSFSSKHFCISCNYQCNL